jgi:hypothetical protein
MTTMTTTTSTSPRLATIVLRHQKTWLRDMLFAACVVLTAAVSVATVSTASHAASSQLVQR